MRCITSVLPVLAIAGLSAAFLPAGVVEESSSEPGVVPEGTSLVVKAGDAIIARKAYKTTLYGASVAENVVGPDEKILIPKGATVELGVSTLSYLGPGGAGLSELAVEVRSVTVNGMSYPVKTIGRPGAGGLGVNRYVAKVAGGGEEADEVRTNGRNINVPAGTLLAFQVQEPIRISPVPLSATR
jgi:hypothetical protein